MRSARHGAPVQSSKVIAIDCVGVEVKLLGLSWTNQPLPLARVTAYPPSWGSIASMVRWRVGSVAPSAVTLNTGSDAATAAGAGELMQPGAYTSPDTTRPPLQGSGSGSGSAAERNAMYSPGMYFALRSSSVLLESAARD